MSKTTINLTEIALSARDLEIIKNLAQQYLVRLQARDPVIKKQCATSLSPTEKKARSRTLHFQHLQSRLQDKLLKKIIIAMEHYVAGDKRLIDNPELLMSHCNGIDFKMPVEIVTLPVGTSLLQMQVHGVGQGETRQGSYYILDNGMLDIADVDTNADLVGVSPIAVQDLGLGGEQRYGVKEKQITQFYVTQEIQALQTTALAILDTWSVTVRHDDEQEMVPIYTNGGARQLHITPTENLSIQPKLRQVWEQCIAIMASDNPSKADEQLACKTFGVYALVLYNRAIFKQENLQIAVDAYAFFYKQLKDSRNPIVIDALETTKAAISMAMVKHKITDDVDEYIKTHSKIPYNSRPSLL